MFATPAALFAAAQANLRDEFVVAQGAAFNERFHALARGLVPNGSSRGVQRLHEARVGTVCCGPLRQREGLARMLFCTNAWEGGNGPLTSLLLMKHGGSVVLFFSVLFAFHSHRGER